MTLDELQALAGRLTGGPVPTRDKKLFAHVGPVQGLLELLPGTILLRGSVLTAVEGLDPPRAEEQRARWLADRIATYVTLLYREQVGSSILVLEDAELLARYRVPLTFLYDFVGDLQAIILQLAPGGRPRGWQPPAYVHLDPEATPRYFERCLGTQCIRGRSPFDPEG